MKQKLPRVLVGLGSMILIASLLAGCGDLFDPAAAVVADEKITIDEVEQALEDFRDTPEYERLTQQDDPGTIDRQFQQNYLGREVRRRVLDPAAAQLGVTVTDDDVRDRVEQIKADFPSEEEFNEALAAQGLTLEQLDELVRAGELEERLRAQVTGEIAPTEEEIRAEYEENRDTYDEYHAAHILVNERDEAEDIFQQLQAAPAGRVDELFERLARRHSTDPGSAQDGGDLGYASPDRYVDSFAIALTGLEPGEISPPVESSFGWHVIRLIDKRTAPFGSVRDEIESQLIGEQADAAWAEWLQRTYEAVDVRVNPRFGRLDMQSGQIVDEDASDIPGAATPPPPTVEAPAE